VGDDSEFDIAVLTRHECFELLGKAYLGRVGASIGALPVILPVHFALAGESVLFRSVRGTKLDAATSGAVVAFQADGYGPHGDSGWSVLLQGVATTVTDEAMHQRADAADIRPWVRSDFGHRLVQVEATNLTGRRFALVR
jgi:nitroimidazol reductase NimA-like FMN-containing flavoprotein (pyridoxamine 5'-phosphate oxidase superfamily)